MNKYEKRTYNLINIIFFGIPFSLLAFLIFAYSASAETITFTGNSPNLGASDSVGALTGVQQYAIVFSPSADADTVSVTLPIAGQGSPSDDVMVAIYSNAGGSPDTSLGSAVLTSSVTATCDPYWSADITGLTLLSGGTYWVVVYRSGSQSATDYYWDCVSSTGSDTSKYKTTGAWSNYGQSFEGEVLLSEIGGGGGGSATSTTATSTIEQVQENTNWGFALFLASMWFIMWIFKRR